MSDPMVDKIQKNPKYLLLRNDAALRRVERFREIEEFLNVFEYAFLSSSKCFLAAAVNGAFPYPGKRIAGHWAD